MGPYVRLGHIKRIGHNGRIRHNKMSAAINTLWNIIDVRAKGRLMRLFRD